MALGASITKDFVKVASTTSLGRARLALRAFAITSLLALTLVSSAWADDAVPAGSTQATGVVNQLGADPTVSITKRRHCVSSRATFAPRYTGGGGVVVSYLYINGEEVASRHSAGAIKLSAKRLARGANGYELISEFADGRAASTYGTIRRCK